MKEILIQVACMLVYVFAGFPIFKRAYRNIRMGDIFSEHILLVIASAGSIALGEWEEAISVIVLYRIGEYFQAKSIEKSRKMISDAIDAAGENTDEDLRSIAEDATLDRSGTESFITRLAHIYTPVICAAAVLITLVPTLLGGEFSVWFEKAMVFIVTSCPCAMVISIPLSFFGGISNASGKGILFKSANALETLAKKGPDAVKKGEIVYLPNAVGGSEEAIKISKKTMRIAYENIILALGAKVCVIVLALFGISSIFLAEFADVGVCLIAIANSVRCLK